MIFKINFKILYFNINYSDMTGFEIKIRRISPVQYCLVQKILKSPKFKHVLKIKIDRYTTTFLAVLLSINNLKEKKIFTTLGCFTT